MSNFKVFKTEYKETFGVLEPFTNGYGETSIMICTSTKPQLFGVDSDEESLKIYFSKYRIYGVEEERKFDWDLDIPKDWKLVEAEIVIKD